MSFSAKELADEVERLCDEAGLTREHLADLAGIKPETLGKILGGHQTTSQVVVSSLRNAARVVILEKNSGVTGIASLREGAPPYGGAGSGMDELDLMLAAAAREARARSVDFDRESFLKTMMNTASEHKQFKVARMAATKLAQIYWEKETRPPSRRGRADPEGSPSSGIPPGFAEGIGKALHKKVVGDVGESSPSGEVGGPNAPVGQPRRGTAVRYSSRRSSQDPAPESHEGGKGESDHHKK